MTNFGGQEVKRQGHRVTEAWRRYRSRPFRSSSLDFQVSNVFECMGNYFIVADRLLSDVSSFQL